MSSLALWFFIGALVAIAVLITDFCIDRKNKLALFKEFGRSMDAESVEHFCKVYYPIECTLWVLLGPTSVYFFWNRTWKLRKATNKLASSVKK